MLTFVSELNSLETNGVGDGRHGRLGIRVVTDFAFLYYSLSRKLRCYLELPIGGGVPHHVLELGKSLQVRGLLFCPSLCTCVPIFKSVPLEIHLFCFDSFACQVSCHAPIQLLVLRPFDSDKQFLCCFVWIHSFAQALLGADSVVC